MLAQTRGDHGDRLNGAVDICLVVLLGIEGDSQIRASHLGRYAHGSKDVALFEGTCRAGGAGAQTDAELVEKDEGALVVDSVERDGDDSGEPEGRLRGAEYTHALDAGKPTNESRT